MNKTGPNSRPRSSLPRTPAWLRRSHSAILNYLWPYTGLLSRGEVHWDEPAPYISMRAPDTTWVVPRESLSRCSALWGERCSVVGVYVSSHRKLIGHSLSQSSASSLLRWLCAHWLKRVVSVLSDVPISVATLRAESWALIRILRSARLRHVSLTWLLSPPLARATNDRPAEMCSVIQLETSPSLSATHLGNYPVPLCYRDSRRLARPSPWYCWRLTLPSESLRHTWRPARSRSKIFTADSVPR